MPNNYRRITNSLLTHLCLARAEHPARQSIARRLSLGARFRRQPLAPTARPCGLRGLTARRGQAKRGHHAMNADNRRHDDLGKGNCPMGKTPPKTLLTCGASYKPPALPGDIYWATYSIRGRSSARGRVWSGPWRHRRAAVGFGCHGKLEISRARLTTREVELPRPLTMASPGPARRRSHGQLGSGELVSPLPCRSPLCRCLIDVGHYTF